MVSVPTGARRTLLVAAVFVAWFAAWSGTRPLNVPDEGRYAEVAREMLVSRDFVTPHLNGVPFLDKPPLFYWLEDASFAVLGVRPFSARLVPALFAALGCLLVLLAGARLHGWRAGLLSAIVLAANPYYFGASQYVNHDLAVAVLVSAAVFAFVAGLSGDGPGRAGWIVAGCAAAGLAVLTKGLIGVVFPFGFVGLWVLLTRGWSRVPWPALGAGLLVMAGLVLPWALAVQEANPDFLHHFVVVQHFQRFAGRGFNNPVGPGFYPVLLGAGLLPWTPQLPAAVHRAVLVLRGDRVDREANLLLLLWPVLVVLFFSIPRSKIAGYVLPALPPLAVLLGAWWEGALRAGQGRLRAVAVSGWVMAALGLLLAIGSPLVAGRLALQPQAVARLAATGAATLAAAVVVLYAHRRRELALAFAACVASAALLGAGGMLAVPHLIHDGTGSLAERIHPLLRDGDRVACYRKYFYDLPLHLGLRQPLLVVDDWGDPAIAKSDNWRSELWIGLQQRPEAAAWLVTPDRFRAICAGEARCFVVARSRDVVQLEGMALVRIATSSDMVLLATPAAARGVEVGAAGETLDRHRRFWTWRRGQRTPAARDIGNVDSEAPGTRTQNHRLKRPMLYQLS